LLPFSEACERNKGPILEKLRAHLEGHSQVLEIGSGTGQHAVHFASNLTHLTWHPTERLAFLPDLAARIQAEGGPNLRPATVLDVRQTLWPLSRVDAIFTANTLHIMSWTEVCLLFAGIGSTLAPGGVLGIYGPFLYEGIQTAPSNAEFDRSLRQRDPASGLREMGSTLRQSGDVGLHLVADHQMPANNRLLIFQKESY
jgi:SAM-dependent methyltransferase